MLYSVFAAILGELLKQEDQEKYQVLRLMANALSISFSWWVAITLAILLTWVFEASFRRQRKCQEIIDRLQAKSEIPESKRCDCNIPRNLFNKDRRSTTKGGTIYFYSGYQIYE